MNSMAGTPVLVANWLTVAGAIAATIGSGMRAWFTLKEYKDVTDKLGEESTKALFSEARPKEFWVTFVGLFGLPGVTIDALVALRISLMLKRNVSKILRSGGDDARRMVELINQAVAWQFVMLGAFLASVSSIIRAVSAH